VLARLAGHGTEGVCRTVEANRLEAREPGGVRLGRGRLPVCVVRKRLTLRGMSSSPFGHARKCRPPHAPRQEADRLPLASRTQSALGRCGTVSSLSQRGEGVCWLNGGNGLDSERTSPSLLGIETARSGSSLVRPRADGPSSTGRRLGGPIRHAQRADVSLQRRPVQSQEVEASGWTFNIDRSDSVAARRLLSLVGCQPRS
jgi:hypothetical protein